MTSGDEKPEDFNIGCGGMWHYESHGYGSSCPSCSGSEWTNQKRWAPHEVLPVEVPGKGIVATRRVSPAEFEAEVEWSWQSPSTYWKVTRVQPAHQTGRRSFETFVLLLIEFTHHKPSGDRIVVETYVSKKEEMLRLKAFLDAAVELPDGIRLTIHTAKKAPWDDQTPRYRR